MACKNIDDPKLPDLIYVILSFSFFWLFRIPPHRLCMEEWLKFGSKTQEFRATSTMQKKRMWFTSFVVTSGRIPQMVTNLSYLKFVIYDKTLPLLHNIYIFITISNTSQVIHSKAMVETPLKFL